MNNTKTIYAVRMRDNDEAEWGEPDYYPTRKARDTTERYCRIIGGIRTHSYEERVSQDELAQAFSADSNRAARQSETKGKQ